MADGSWGHTQCWVYERSCAFDVSVLAVCSAEVTLRVSEDASECPKDMMWVCRL